MTEPFDEYGDHLRRALHAEADAVVPSPEGLEKIRAKIDKGRERRLWYLRPWLRPLAALSAAIVLSIIAVPATAAFRNFVETGHFGPQGGHGDGQSTAGGRHTQGQPPPRPLPSDTRSSARPSAGLTKSPNVPDITGSCPSGEGKATPSASPSPAPSAISPLPGSSGSRAPHGTCRPGTTPSSPAPHDSGEPSGSSTAQPPASESPSGGSLPSAQSSP